MLSDKVYKWLALRPQLLFKDEFPIVKKLRITNKLRELEKIRLNDFEKFIEEWNSIDFDLRLEYVLKVFRLTTSEYSRKLNKELEYIYDIGLEVEKDVFIRSYRDKNIYSKFEEILFEEFDKMYIEEN